MGSLRPPGEPQGSGIRQRFGDPMALANSVTHVSLADVGTARANSRFLPHDVGMPLGNWAHHVLGAIERPIQYIVDFLDNKDYFPLHQYTRVSINQWEREHGRTKYYTEARIAIDVVLRLIWDSGFPGFIELDVVQRLYKLRDEVDMYLDLYAHPDVSGI